jgi:hypothetical protein
MNAYFRRQELKEQKKRLRKEQEIYNRNLKVHRLLSEYEVAFNLAHGYYPSAQYLCTGYYAVSVVTEVGPMTKNFREKQLINETATLYATMHDKELEHADCD